MDTTNSNASTTAGGVDTGVNLADVLGQVAAAMAAVSTSVNEITNKLNAIEGRIKQTSVNDDNNFETTVVGAHDPYDDIRRTSIINHKLSVSMAENADALMKEYLKYTSGVWARSLDHFCAMNPEVPSRTAKV